MRERRGLHDWVRAGRDGDVLAGLAKHIGDPHPLWTNLCPHVVRDLDARVGRREPRRQWRDDAFRSEARQHGRRQVLAYLVEHRLEDLVAGVAVGVADGDRLVDLVAPAVLLARRRADAAENARERDRPLEDPGRLAPVRCCAARCTRP